MKIENIALATKMKHEIDTMTLEIEQIEKLTQATKPNLEWLFRHYMKKKPTEKTYKGYFCSASLDSIGSIILINPREAAAVIVVKQEEIKELEQQIQALE